ncbi:hypothetical protein G2W53_006450 [Senna tora]|uniref:Uncharacterized protein n=1 Tax=Senna tora TaxID=362788 RepID=A0A834X3N9_9FABA|nr:hypothetical protein G2W53_006450 [Senna tora]
MFRSRELTLLLKLDCLENSFFFKFPCSETRSSTSCFCSIRGRLNLLSKSHSALRLRFKLGLVSLMICNTKLNTTSSSSFSSSSSLLVNMNIACPGFSSVPKAPNFPVSNPPKVVFETAMAHSPAIVHKYELVAVLYHDELYFAVPFAPNHRMRNPQEQDFVAEIELNGARLLPPKPRYEIGATVTGRGMMNYCKDKDISLRLNCDCCKYYYCCSIACESACFGGGGGHCGIVCSIFFSTHLIHPVSIYRLDNETTWWWKHEESRQDQWMEQEEHGEPIESPRYTITPPDPDATQSTTFFSSSESLISTCSLFMKLRLERWNLRTRVDFNSSGTSALSNLAISSATSPWVMLTESPTMTVFFLCLLLTSTSRSNLICTGEASLTHDSANAGVIKDGNDELLKLKFNSSGTTQEGLLLGLVDASSSAMVGLGPFEGGDESIGERRVVVVVVERRGSGGEAVEGNVEAELEGSALKRVRRVGVEAGGAEGAGAEGEESGGHVERSEVGMASAASQGQRVLQHRSSLWCESVVQSRSC